MLVLRHFLGVLVPLLCLTDAFRDDLPCPQPEDIFPCVCHVDENYDMEMDCSQVTSEDQLARVFSAYLPFTTFKKLTIYQNRYLRVLRKGDFGPASFQTINIRSGTLMEVHEEALSQSYASVERLDFSDNRICIFTFQELPLFTALRALFMNGNRLTILSPLQSGSLHTISLSYNLFTQVSVDSFKGLTNIQSIHMKSSGLTFEAGTFSDMPNLAYIDIAENLQYHVPEGLIELSELTPGRVYLDSNNISSIAVWGITGLSNGYLHLAHNYLEEIPEEVFGPIFEEGTTVDLNDNPLACGCDIAWIVTNPDYMSLIMSGAECYNGELLSDLDPIIFEHQCPNNESVIVGRDLMG